MTDQQYEATLKIRRLKGESKRYVWTLEGPLVGDRQVEGEASGIMTSIVDAEDWLYDNVGGSVPYGQRIDLHIKVSKTKED